MWKSYISLSLLSLCIAGQSHGDWQTEYFYLFGMMLTPNENGSVARCEIGNAFKFGPGANRKDYVDFRPSAKALEAMCASFKNVKVEVQHSASGEIQSQFAPWPCIVRPETPDAPECRALKQATE